ncbi:2-phospho-L-lactate guanylyltransferase [Methanolobus halotolerans]|uniref:2-phospho-L-lactate guanylyltransferase n=1 Tax=Methanolobus halotolerans TaxID=2052935 RepID=A0A4E0QQ59_9EURY|nr:2-phospho-L-lactate guanylyltransferase [Methanolobus halotolerans]TGC07026.1 2-phospho-L-lactate guanylyltransferase [Methanolobus halotolerans]
MRAMIPYKKQHAKSRLSPALSLEEREHFVELMLRDVVGSLQVAGVSDIDVLTTPKNGVPSDLDVNILFSEHELNNAINGYLDTVSEPVLIIMADMPLVTPGHIKEMKSIEKDLIIVPGKGGGTNVLFIRNPDSFYVKYYDSSFLNHCRIAEEMGQSVHVYDSFLLSTDIDEPHDLVEIMLHGHGLSKSYIDSKFGMKDNGKSRVKLSLCQ